MNDNQQTLRIVIEYDFIMHGRDTPWGWKVYHNNKLWGSGTAANYEDAMRVFATWKEGQDVASKAKNRSVD